jgi:hypothetical protein
LGPLLLAIFTWKIAGLLIVHASTFDCKGLHFSGILPSPKLLLPHALDLPLFSKFGHGRLCY